MVVDKCSSNGKGSYEMKIFGKICGHVCALMSVCILKICELNVSFLFFNVWLIRWFREYEWWWYKVILQNLCAFYVQIS